MSDKIKKSDEEWRAQLSPEQFQVTRQHGTERAFSGQYYDSKQPGVYHCICCGQPLFTSEEKYDSGSGWPSYWQPIDEAAIETTFDTSHGMTRTEVHCSRCEAHLGHVFPDGPPPSGQRYCINSLSLELKKP